MKYSAKKKASILARHNAGATWKYLAARHGVSVDSLRKNVDPDYRAKCNEHSRKHFQENYSRPTISNVSARGGQVTQAARPPAEVLFEREHAYSAPQSLTATFCGDPPRGRSALDRMGGS